LRPDYKDGASDGEIIHHRDEDALNDNFSNLELMTISKHMSRHKKGKKYPHGYRSAKTRWDEFKSKKSRQ